MTVTGDVASLNQLGGALLAAAPPVSEAAFRTGNAGDLPGWVGPGADDFATTWATQHQQVAEASRMLGDAGKAIMTYASSIQAAQALWSQAETAAAKGNLAVESNGSIGPAVSCTVGVNGTASKPADASKAAGQLVGQAQGLVQDAERRLLQVLTPIVYALEGKCPPLAALGPYVNGAYPGEVGPTDKGPEEGWKPPLNFFTPGAGFVVEKMHGVWNIANDEAENAERVANAATKTASALGRQLRTGATPEERSAAARLLRSAGQDAKALGQDAEDAQAFAAKVPLGSLIKTLATPVSKVLPAATPEALLGFADKVPLIGIGATIADSYLEIHDGQDPTKVLMSNGAGLVAGTVVVAVLMPEDAPVVLVVAAAGLAAYGATKGVEYIYEHRAAIEHALGTAATATGHFFVHAGNDLKDWGGDAVHGAEQLPGAVLHGGEHVISGIGHLIGGL